jgi:hypothetical protein
MPVLHEGGSIEQSDVLPKQGDVGEAEAAQETALV